jgi:predicted GH43/DUF377 family glycosyl hydrolase
MAWERKGLFFRPNDSKAWSRNYAQVPTVDVLSNDIWRIYYSSRDELNRSSISYIDVEARNPSNIIFVNPSPILNPGSLGAFDSCGVMPSSVVTVNEKKYMFYTGWDVRKNVPYHNSIGLAVSNDGGVSYERLFNGPILTSTPQEPYFVGTACVLFENGLWRNWYSVCTGWSLVEGVPEPSYHIKYAESKDGINWERKGQIAIDYKDEDECGIVRATVLKGHFYEMWFSYRQGIDYRTDPSKGYRIGYAKSLDGISWERCDDDNGMSVSLSGWDSQMVAYPCVVSIDNKSYMFYNGNHFGKEGMGYAEWVADE